MRLYESRDSFQQAGARFERAQVVRLDPRWIAMLKYHLGTIYEDIWIPASGETDAHLGNTLPAFGFVEITIKDMEAAMNLQLSKLASRGLLQHDTNAGAQYSVDSNTLVKKAAALKETDLIRYPADPEGKPSESEYTWKVVALEYATSLPVTSLHLGEEYGVYLVEERAVFRMKLIGLNIHTTVHEFEHLDKSFELPNFVEKAAMLPYVYPKGTRVHGAVSALVIESVIRDSKKSHARLTLPMADVGAKAFKLDVGHSHVVEAIGKPHGSKVHFECTTEEPYGVCCLYGLKVTLGMHHFGTRRWQQGIIDDVRSHSDTNTRVVGDFTKIVNTHMIIDDMHKTMMKDRDWQLHWEKLVGDLGYGEVLVDVVKVLTVYIGNLVAKAPYVRSHLQTRFFETGDNFYIGMEFNREYDAWKGRTVERLSAPVYSDVDAMAEGPAKEKAKKQLGLLRKTIVQHLDRLWFKSTLEVIERGDVYNPGAKSLIPTLYMIDSLQDVKLGTLPVGESFRLTDHTARTNRYEVLFRSGNSLGGGAAFCRDIEGHVVRMPDSTVVRRGSNLSRNPSGNAESKVSCATFPVGHYVNHRVARLNNAQQGYVFCFLGDEQSSPHFMRYSGLTGAAIGAMAFNTFLKHGLGGVGFQARFKEFAISTNWSNSEVVTRGTGSNYGTDGFLHPGFPYAEGIKYLGSKVIEATETGLVTRADKVDGVLSDDWKVKFASSLVPRGMEYNHDYLCATLAKLQSANVDELVRAAASDKALMALGVEGLAQAIRDCDKSIRKGALEEGDDVIDANWKSFMSSLDVPAKAKEALETHVWVAGRVDKLNLSIVNFARSEFDKNNRVSSQVVNQPPAVDSLIDDYAAEAQGVSQGLATTATLAAAGLTIALSAADNDYKVRWTGTIISAFPPIMAFATLVNVARYKNRNEDWRVMYLDQKYLPTLKAIYDCMSVKDREMVTREQNPYYMDLEALKKTIVAKVAYYDFPAPAEFLEEYETLVNNLSSVEHVVKFQQKLTTKFLPETYSENSLLQYEFMPLYETVEQLRTSLVKLPPRRVESAAALFVRYAAFRPKLEASLQRGQIKWGYWKEKHPKHYLPVAIGSYFINTLWPARTHRSGCLSLPVSVEEANGRANTWKPILTETKELVAEFKALQEQVSAPALRRETVDVEALRCATSESYVSSYIILLASWTFLSGFLFITANVALIADPQTWSVNLGRGASWSLGIITPLAAILASYYLGREFLNQMRCDRALAVRLRKLKNRGDEVGASHLRHVMWIAFFQQFTSLLRIASALAAGIALVWAWVFRERQFLTHKPDYVDVNHPLFVAVGAISGWGLAIILRAIIEYSILWSVDAKLGQYVCAGFNEELLDIQKSVSTAQVMHKAKQVQDRTSWEYTARVFLKKYRFDTVFRANRLGSILQYIQAGLVEP